MTADKAFNERGAYFNDVFDVDEIWIVFDTEKELHPCWNDNWEIVKSLRKRCKYADVKLFMTKGCIEYFFLLHYKKARPLIATPQVSNVRLFKDSLVKIIGDIFDSYDSLINLFGGQCQII